MPSPDAADRSHAGRPVVAVLGLGEAGGAIVADLLAAGATVRAYDPAVAAPAGTTAATDEADAARGAALVLSVNAAHAARDALSAGRAGIGDGAVWADLNTASPQLERELATLAAAVGVAFADVSLMSPVPGRGLGTPMLASGTGARGYAELLAPLGGSVTVLEGPAGDAAQRKLLRSVFYKGMAASAVEAIAAARAAGLEEWTRELIGSELERSDATTVTRLEQGSVRHAVRREHEMAAAVELLESLDVPARVASASRDWSAQLARERPGEPC